MQEREEASQEQSESRPAATKVVQSTRWCVTWNNYPETWIDSVTTLYKEHFRYLIAGMETAPTTGTKHLQIYLELRKKKTRNGVNALFKQLPASVHLELAKGSAEDNLTYCSKEHLALILGAPVTERQRTDLLAIKDAIDDGASMEEISQKYFTQWLQYRRGMEEYLDMRAARRDDVPKIFIWWGPTGTGKTRRAFTLAATDYNDDIWVWPGEKWYDGYINQKVALFDEFHGGEEQGLTFAKWKCICDRYRYKVPVKGGYRNWNPNVIIFTSNIDPKLWWIDDKKPRDWETQFNRRVTSIDYMDEAYVEEMSQE